MRLLFTLLATVGGLAIAGLLTGPNHPLRPVPCGPCRASDGYLIPSEPAAHAALRFLSHGQLLRSPGPFATYSAVPDKNAPKGYPTPEQLRFGSIYLAKGPGIKREGAYHYLASVVCTQGKDRMQVYVQPPTNRPYWLYDSIPFRPGRYELVEAPLYYFELPFTRRGLDSLGITSHSFAAYYRLHRPDLERDNPFAGCRFYYQPSAGDLITTPDGYVPEQPTEIFNLLLAHNIYLERNGWHLRRLASYEQVVVQP